ncbi:hypothetical protein OG785_35900 [Streptomyces sp. NBC_00006]|uniref:hypothetical protein n=1 Tax=Streptomyces sp. NBC_00006 TaxID=2975619 RepID=UPI0022581BAE|nr:hypothetical protein [Streptomyces sp. NBC_00006]MCX5535926.1 hypothetical protein [Streptomyces sp. NBC_00006]
MFRNHRRKAVLTAAALMATTTLLTACQGGADGGDASSSSGSSTAASDAKEKSGADGAGSAGGSTESQAGSGSGSGSTSQGKGVSGTWFGTVSYLAPGKYTVSDLKDTEQAFFTSTDTNIQGAGRICGDAEGQAATPCTEKELEAAAKKGVPATVKVKNGTAVSIVEDHSSSGGGGDSDTVKPSGTRSGELGYLAPGKYSLVDSDGNTSSFFSATATTINGNGWICGENGDNKRCTEGELEAAAKKGGVRVVVKLYNGAAVTIDEEHN